MTIDSGTGWLRVVAAALTALAATVVGVGGATVTGASTSTVRFTLSANVAAVPDFNNSGYSHVSRSGVVTFPNPCVGVDHGGQPHFIVNDRSVACTNYVLRAINRARHLEGVRSMTLPTNWYRLSTAQQLFVVIDLERVDRGLPPYLGLNAALARSAQRGALATRDPDVAPGFVMGAMGSTWAGAGSVLEADFSWLYDDGWGGSAAATSNYDCTSPTASRCWGHRQILLGRFTGLGCAICELGTGFASVHGAGSYTVLVERPAGPAPATVFSWSRTVLPFLKATTTTTTSSVAATSPGQSNGTPNALG